MRWYDYFFCIHVAHMISFGIVYMNDFWSILWGMLFYYLWERVRLAEIKSEK